MALNQPPPSAVKRMLKALANHLTASRPGYVYEVVEDGKGPNDG